MPVEYTSRHSSTTLGLARHFQYVFLSFSGSFLFFLYIVIIINNSTKKKILIMDLHSKIHSDSLDNKMLSQQSPHKQVYQCQCGKQYQSFAAIYLHFRTKHDIKLSTRPVEARRKEINDEGLRRIVYSLDNNSQLAQIQKVEGQQCYAPCSPPSPQISSSSTSISSLGYIAQLKQCIDGYLSTSVNSPKWIYRMLAQFLQQQWSENKTKSIREIPSYLNRFVLDYIPTYNRSLKIRSSTWRKLCIELQKFSRWLNEQKHTDLIVIYQEGIEK